MSLDRRYKIEQLNEQLEILKNQMYTLNRLSKDTSQQFESVKKLGISQATFFMSSHAVFQAINEEKETKKQKIYEKYMSERHQEEDHDSKNGNGDENRNGGGNGPIELDLEKNADKFDKL